MPPTTIPIATYRLQFNAGFTFADAAALVDYLSALGISHVYASSYLAAVPGSTHGYDVVDPTRLNPEIGTADDHRRWVTALRAHGMGHILDVVPNHMGIAQSANPWWQDVLENGQSSVFAHVFDIDWAPLHPELRDKVLLPILGDHYGAVLERQDIRLRYTHGAFVLDYFDRTLPVAPGTYNHILEGGSDALVTQLGGDTYEATEFLSILTAIRRLPGREVHDVGLLQERAREKEIIKRRLAVLTDSSDAVRTHVEARVTLFNGTPGDPRSFDWLDDLLTAQAYRLAYWRVAAEEINYRRFFDINELAAIRMEDPAVFDLVHGFLFELLRDGLVDGVRLDHVDGLYDPAGYLARLQARARDTRPDLFSEVAPLFVLVEKILGLEERLPDWPVHGTSGYDFLATVNGLFVDSRHEKAITRLYERFSHMRTPFKEIAYRSKQRILGLSMSSELSVLAHQLNQFSERNRHYRDFTLDSLVDALGEVIACFPVYRTYVNEREHPSPVDRQDIDFAVTEAKRRNPGRPLSVFEFVRNLLLKQADYIPAAQHEEHMRLVGKFQQLTSPVTAKGIEDTAVYNYHRLVSLNEVGGEPDVFGVLPARLHEWLAERATRWPHALSGTSTHDTKRSEDVRARIHALSEMPAAWEQALGRWARLNRRARTIVEGRQCPGRNEEYLLYQTLIGTWPLGSDPFAGQSEAVYVQRIVDYMRKAMREAKAVTSWLDPSAPHEAAMERFIRVILSPDHTLFREDFSAFQRCIAHYGLYTSLAQLTIKIGAPGIPDLYQGTELWDFSLVDPDNRRPVDYGRRRALLEEIQRATRTDETRDALLRQLVDAPSDDRLKLFVTTGLLQYRRAHDTVFRDGTYLPVHSAGARRENVFAFERAGKGQRILVVVPRLVAGLQPHSTAPPLGAAVWGDTDVVVPTGAPATYREVLTGRTLAAGAGPRGLALNLADIFAQLPVAVLEAC